MGFIFASCKKSAPTITNAPNPQQKITYKRNGIYKEFSGEEKFILLNSTSNAFPPYKLMYNLVSAGSDDEYMSLFIVSTTSSQLTVGDYACQYPIQTSTSGSGTLSFPVARLKLRIYSSNLFVDKEYIDKIGDFSQVKVTKIENGYASGSFSASVTLTNGTEKILITEGTFTNFKMI